ncbi:MAG: YfhO family protein [Prevotellaceae bacterium]|nr:YfhO family protein [Candidatus Colivivens equi]
MSYLKKYWADISCVILFIIIALLYFAPATFDGRRLNQHDNVAADGLTVEINQYRNAHDGDTPRWTNSIFGGMPTYQIAPSYDSTDKLSFLDKIYHLWLPDYVFYIFISMLGFYILLRAFDFKQWMAALGAIIWAFSSYFFIIIAAGHIWKVLTLAYIPPTIAGVVLCYKKKYLLGLTLTAFFASMQILSNHVQMTYYFLIPEILLVVAFLVDAIQKKDIVSWIKSTGCIVIAAVIAIGVNFSNLYHTYEYSNDTMRGKSELVKEEKIGDQTDSGLERSYITNWSYGIGETWTFLIPNVMGGASVPLSDNKVAMNKANAQLNSNGIYGAFTQYWGEQPGTSGPVYLGALVCMLFVLALFIIPRKSPIKWALIVATILSILLAWGKNFMGFTDFFIDHVPMYSKFRTVSSILVVAEFTIPLLSMLGLKELLNNKSALDTKAKLKALYWSAGITAGICLLFAIIPTTIFGDCISSQDRNAIDSYVSQGYFDNLFGQTILGSISTMRQAMLTADAWRSFVIILIGSFFIYRLVKGHNKTAFIPNSVLIIALCLIDMWAVNKRYLNDAMFTQPYDIQALQKTSAEQYILEQSGTNRNYRVMNFTVSTFNDNTTSASFSSVGGYHAAKLRRYQELIEQHISGEMSKVFEYLTHPDTIANPETMFPVINMMNTKWFIMPAQDGSQIPVENPAAFGNAWFVDEVLEVNNANEEIDALKQVSPKHVAVVAKEFTPILGTINAVDSAEIASRNITQTSLVSDEVKYEVDSQNGGIVVFSEIYYPGWIATIDGQPADIARADYVLRAMKVPAGHHEIVMQFHPQSITTTETIANICFVLINALFVCTIGTEIKKRKKKIYLTINKQQ